MKENSHEPRMNVNIFGRAGRLLVPEGIIHLVFNASAQIWLIYIYFS